MSFFSIPISGLTTSQASLKTISNNLANVDTDGFKSETLRFADLFNQSGQTNGAGDPIQDGAGVKIDMSEADMSDGTVQSTGVASNMALSGNGYFVLQQGNGDVVYSRAGDFTTTDKGQLVSPSGALVLGYPAANGVVNTTAALQPLTIGIGSVLPASATTAFTSTTNLDSSAAVGTPVLSEIQVYDSLGTPHQLTVTFTKTASDNWSYAVTAPSSDGQLTSGPATTGSNVTLASGSLTFNTSGELTSTTPITLAGFQPNDGAASMNISWDLADSTGNGLITQANLESSTTATTQNGEKSATLTSYAVGGDGTIEATYSNGSTSALGQVAVASVTNPQGMAQIGDNLFQVSQSSGAASVGIAGSNGRGTITGGSVEGSNVDTATQFSEMIIAQQAYEANAKSVTTFNQVLQATLQMIQQ